MSPEVSRSKSYRLLWLSGLIVLVLLWLAIVGHLPKARATLVQGDNDDIMRWLSVQGWLQGQGWFDMTQYRVEPPLGLSMHWSRYLDAAIGGVQTALGWVLPPGEAALWTLALWPNLLLAGFLALTAWRTSGRVGPVGAIFAMLFILTWMPFRGITFSPGRIDHHNIQIILTSVIAFALISVGRPSRAGGVAGIAAALSLAIGLETLVFVALAGVILAIRAAFDRPGAWARLLAFALTLPVAAAVFFAGQTAPQDWGTPHCDALATPVLAVTLIAALACTGMAGARGRLRHPALRLGLLAAISLAGLYGFAGLLGPCRAGPYGMLPAEAQAFITTYISEALPAAVFAAARPFTFANVMLPIFLICLAATVLWWRQPAVKTADNRAAVGQMLVFAWGGLIGSFIQIRLNMIAAPALPFLAGFVGAELAGRIGGRSGLRGLFLALPLALGVFAVQRLSGPAYDLTSHLAGWPGPGPVELPSFDKGCRTEAQLAPLNALPAARILTTLNLGAPMVLTTHHSALSVPYQRGAHTFWNGSFPFRTQGQMLQAIRQSAPDYVLICRKAAYDQTHAFAIALRDGTLPNWLVPVEIGSADLLVLRVRPETLPPP